MRCGIDVNVQDKRGFAAIHYAAELEDIRILKALLDNRADVNLTGRDNYTPIMVAAYNQNIKAVALLLDHDADMKTCSQEGLNFFDIVIDSHNSDLCRTIASHYRYLTV